MTVDEVAKPHIVFLSSPGMGHIIPLLELAKRLVTYHDFHVSFLVITTNEASAAQEQLLRSPTLPSGLDIVELPPVDVFSLTTDDMLVLTRVCVIVEESLKSLKHVLVELRNIKALVVDLFCTQAFQVCRELSIPVYSFCTGSIALLTLSLYLPTLDREVDGEFVDLPEPIKVPGCTPIRTEDLLDQIKNRKIDEYKWYLLHVNRLPLAAGIFLNSWEDLEPAGLKAVTENSFFKQIPTPRVHPIGPLIRQEETLTAAASNTECVAWLDKQPPGSVLFVSLGSGGTLTAEQLTELAWGLELSQHRFILVVRSPTNSSASAAFFNVGSEDNHPKAYLPEGFLDRTEERGLVVPSWAPQEHVLKHPSTGGFLSHCGWNSILESVTYGVPIIAWPLYAEQRMNATMLAEEVGVGIKPEVREGNSTIGRKEIERVVRIVMESEDGKLMKIKALKLQESAAKALNACGSSYDSLGRVVEEWKAEPKCTCIE